MIEFLSFSRPERPDRLSMVVDYLNVCRVSPMPYKTDSILLVDSNAVLSETVALQSLKIVAVRSRKIAQLPCRVQCFQFSVARGARYAAAPARLSVRRELLRGNRESS
jgi:hypothetical protein